MSEKNKKIVVVGILAAICLAGAVLWLSFCSNEDEKKESDSVSAELVVPDGQIFDYKEAGVVDFDSYTKVEVSVEPDEDEVRYELASELDDFEPISKDIEVKEGEYVYVDYVGRENGVENDDYGETDALILIGEHSYIEAFENSLKGMKVGKTYQVPIQYPSDYSEKSIAGKTIEFEISVKAKFNDNYASKMSKGKYKTVDSYLEHLKKQLRKDNMENIEELAWEAFVEKCGVTDYPEKMVEEEVDNLYMQYQGFAEINGVSTEELLESIGMDDASIRELAQDAVRDRMLAKTVAGIENIEPDEETGRQCLIDIMDYEESDETYEELLQDYEENYGNRPKDDILVKIVKEMIAENAVIK